MLQHGTGKTWTDPNKSGRSRLFKPLFENKYLQAFSIRARCFKIPRIPYTVQYEKILEVASKPTQAWHHFPELRSGAVWCRASDQMLLLELTRLTREQTFKFKHKWNGKLILRIHNNVPRNPNTLSLCLPRVAREFALHIKFLPGRFNLTAMPHG